MKTEEITHRRYDLDWLRVIAFAILMFFHTGMGFTSYDWHVKNYESSWLLDETIRFLHQWRMPLLFFISGAAVWFALEKYGPWRYLGERQKRLLLPLVFGMLVIIPPQVYCERVYQRQGYASFWDFYPTIFTSGSYPQGNLSWHHLWYIPYIWAFSLITFPAFAWLRSQRGRQAILKFQGALTKPAVLYLLFLPSALAEILLRPFFPGDSDNLISDWGNFGHKLTFFIIGFVLASGIGLAEVIRVRRVRYLAAAILSVGILEYVWHSTFRLPAVLYRCLSNFEIWMWLLAALGFARQYLNSNPPVLRYATNAVYPFYVLHQTVIVMLLLPLVYVDLGLWEKYFLVLIGTALITWALYHGLISRINVLRVCFGLKARDRAQTRSLPGIAERLPIQSGPGSLGIGLFTVLVTGFACTAAAQGKLVPIVVSGPSLASNKLKIADTQPVAVYLPPSYSQSSKRYPVIYLLPNFNTPVWRYTAGSYQGFRLKDATDRLVQAKKIPELLVVIPNTMHFLGCSWCRNSSLTGNWEDFLTKDLVSYIDSHFRTIATRDARALAGHGVGGTGALELALKHADLFSGVYVMSPAVLVGADLDRFSAGADIQSARWQDLTSEWRRLDEASAFRALRLYMQARLNTSSRNDLFDALRVSCVAAGEPSTPVFPYIDFRNPNSMDSVARTGRWAEMMGDWEAKVRAYVLHSSRLSSITIEYGRQEEYDFIVHGAQYVSGVMHALNVPNTLAVGEGSHDGALGRRLETAMLPTLGNALKTE